MKRLILYLSILSTCHLQAQDEISYCDEPDLCGKLDCLYSKFWFHEAFTLMVGSDSLQLGDCDPLLRSKVLSANFRFREAEYALQVEAPPALHSIYEIERKRIAELQSLLKSSTEDYIVHIANNTEHNDLVSFLSDKGPVIISDSPVIESYFPRKIVSEHRYHLSFGQEYLPEAWQGKLGLDCCIQIGTGTYGNDSTLYLRLIPKNPFDGENGTQGGIYGPDMEAFIEKEYPILHPHMAGDTLFFASIIDGGYGGMDIWFLQLSRLEDHPQNLGPRINTPYNEVFPGYNDEKLFFSSDRTDRGFGAYDIYYFDWKKDSLYNANFPINGAYDDLNFTIGKKADYLISNRAGSRGGDDVYRIDRVEEKLFFKELLGKIEANGMDLTGSEIILRNADGTFVGKTTVDANGYFMFPHIKGMENYEIEAGDLPEGSSLKVYNEEGTLVEEVKMGRNGRFNLELLAPEDYFITRMENEDESVLSVDISGLFESTKKDPEGFKIYLEDSNGELIGLTYTDSTGKFVFEAVKPDQNYVIKTEVTDPTRLIRIFGESGETISSIKPGDDNSFVYVRLSGDEKVITITNEADKKVKISEGEKFNLRVLYFDLDRYDLTEESRNNLSNLIVLLKKNPHITLRISGHTDSRGKAEYNLLLSQRRIDAVVQFLASSGIDRDRMEGIGYGEQKLINKCKDGVECTEEEHAANRRTEMRIYEKENNHDN